MPTLSFDPGVTVLLRPDPDDDPNDPEVQKESRRPYVLLTPCSHTDDTVILAYGSGRPSQADLRAAHVKVIRGSHLFHLTGFTKTTYVYPSRLVAPQGEELVHLGRLIDEFPELRDRALPCALGYDTGTFADGPAAGTWRGLVVELTEDGSAPQSSHAIVVADPVYSDAGEFLNVIPICPTDRVVDAFPNLVFPGGLSWVKQLGWAAALAAATFTYAVRRKDDILRNLKEPIDVQSMKTIDHALMAAFDGREWKRA